MDEEFQRIESFRERMPDDVFAWVNISAITDFFISAEAKLRTADEEESSRKHLEALIKEVFKDGD